MQVDYWAVFLIGFLGGFSHCIGMCGGFVFTYTVKINENEGQKVRGFWHQLSPQLLYNSGRLLTYTFLGEIFGLLGSTMGVVLAIRDFQGALQLLAGIFMIVMGLDLSGILPNVKPDSFPGISKFKSLIQVLFDKVNRRNVFGLGIVLGLVPCGLVYALGAKAAATQSIFGGFMTMLLFGLGTFPAMLLTGMTTHLISAKIRGNLYKIAAIFVGLLGILSVLRGIDSLGWIRLYWLP